MIDIGSIIIAGIYVGFIVAVWKIYKYYDQPKAIYVRKYDPPTWKDYKKRRKLVYNKRQMQGENMIGELDGNTAALNAYLRRLDAEEQAREQAEADAMESGYCSMFCTNYPQCVEKGRCKSKEYPEDKKIANCEDFEMSDEGYETWAREQEPEF